MSIPFVYLGVPIGGNQYRVNLWNWLLDKVKRKLLCPWLEGSQ